MAYAFGSLDELGEGPGFRKIRQALGVTAFGVNAIVIPPGVEGRPHYHDTQDELYFVHRGTARFELPGEARELGPGGLLHVESTTPRRVTNVGSDDLVLFVVGGKGGYVERDGHPADPTRLGPQQRGQRIDRSFQTDARAEPARPDDDAASGVVVG